MAFRLQVSNGRAKPNWLDLDGRPIPTALSPNCSLPSHSTQRDADYWWRPAARLLLVLTLRCRERSRTCPTPSSRSRTGPSRHGCCRSWTWTWTPRAASLVSTFIHTCPYLCSENAAPEENVGSCIFRVYHFRLILWKVQKVQGNAGVCVREREGGRKVNWLPDPSSF